MNWRKWIKKWVIALILLIGVQGYAEEPPIRLYPVPENGLWGFMDPRGMIRIEPVFDRVTAFAEGAAGVSRGRLWGFIDGRGRWIVEPEFSEVLPFSEGLAGVRTDRGWGFLGADGHMVIYPRFDRVEPFSGGRAAVSLGGRLFYVDRAGNLIWSEDGLGGLPPGKGAVDRSFRDRHLDRIRGFYAAQASRLSGALRFRTPRGYECWFAGAQLLKISVEGSEDRGRRSFEAFYFDNQVIFVREQLTEEIPDMIFDRGFVDRTVEERFYLSGGRLIAWIDPRGRDRSPGSPGFFEKEETVLTKAALAAKEALLIHRKTYPVEVPGRSNRSGRRNQQGPTS